MDKLDNKMGIGIIVRDHEGEVMGFMMASKPYITDPVVDEAVVALAATVFSRDMRLKKVILEDDVLQIVPSLRMNVMNWSKYDQLITNARVIPSGLQALQVNHIWRKSNDIAHRLAKEGLCHVEECTSFDGRSSQFYSRYKKY